MLYSYIYIALYYIIVYSYHIILYYITIVWSWLAASSRVLALASFCLVLLLSHLVSANLSRSSSPILYKWYIASQFARLSSSSEINKVTSFQRYNHNIDKYLWHEHEKNIKSHCTRSVQCTMCQVSAMYNVQCARSVQGQARSNEPAVGTPLQGEIFFSEQVFCSSGNCPPLMQSNLGDIHDFTTYHQMSTKEPQMWNINFPPKARSNSKLRGGELLDTSTRWFHDLA